MYLQNRDFKYPDEAIHLMFSANRWEMKEQILKDLTNGVTLICDRYAFSGVAYSAAKVLYYFFWVNLHPLGTWLWMVQNLWSRSCEARSNILHRCECRNYKESQWLRVGALWESWISEASEWVLPEVQRNGARGHWSLGHCRRWWQEHWGVTLGNPRKSRQLYQWRCWQEGSLNNG